MSERTTISEHYGKLQDHDRRWDIAFWQAAGPEAIFAAAWEMILDYRLVHDHDADYGALLDAVHTSFAHVIDAKATLFTTSAENLWDTFLTNLPAEHDIHTCTACRKFVETFGGLVVIEDTSSMHTALWGSHTDNGDLQPAVNALQVAVERATVTGVLAPEVVVMDTVIAEFRGL